MTSPTRLFPFLVAALLAAMRLAPDAGAQTTQVPTLQFTSPPSDVAVVSGDNVPFAIAITDPSKVLAKLEIFLNGQRLFGTGPLPAYVYNAVAPAPGTYSIRAVVTDVQGRQNSITRTIVVTAPAPTRPTAALVTPVDGRQFAAGSTVTLTTAAANVDGSLPDHVDFYADGGIFASFDGATGRPRAIGGGLLPETRVNPAPAAGALAGIFSATYTLPGADQLISLLAVSVSKAGQGAITAAVNVRSLASTTDRAPRVALNSARQRRLRLGDTLRIPVSISDPDAAGGSGSGASASIITRSAANPRDVLPPSVTNALIAHVEYFIDQLKTNETLAPAPDQSAPPAGDVTFTPDTRGVYVVTAVATDATGLATVSDPVLVEVVPPPTVNLALDPGVVPTLTEGGPKIKVLVTRDGDLTSDLTVFLQLRGSATPDVDYTSPGDHVIIPAGKSSAKLRLKSIDDTVHEGTETINIKLVAAPAGEYVRGPVAKLKVTLNDND